MVPVQSLPRSSNLATRCVRVCGLSSKLQKTGFCPTEFLSHGHCSALGCSVARGVCPGQSTPSTASKCCCAASSDFLLGPGISVSALGASCQLRVSFLLPWAFPSLGFLVKKTGKSLPSWQETHLDAGCATGRALGAAAPCWVGQSAPSPPQLSSQIRPIGAAVPAVSTQRWACQTPSCCGCFHWEVSGWGHACCLLSRSYFRAFTFLK